MGKSLGIAAFVLLLISLPIPVVGNFITFIALLVLAAAAFYGEKMWVVVVDLISWVKVFFLSPTLHMAMFGGGYARSAQKWGQDANRSLGIQDPALDGMIDGNARALEQTNTVVVLVVLALLIAPLAIMLWRSRQSRAPAVAS